MRELVSPAHIPIRIWARSISPETLRLLERIAAQPWAVEHVAAMADAHASEGVAVGTVFATEGTVVPGALGGDLGCGMSATKLALEGVERTVLRKIVDALGRAIPTGSATHHGRGVEVPDGILAPSLSTRTLDHARDRLAPRHLGTLGGGNHFLELAQPAGGDADGNTWLLVHSGSRGLGGAIADHHRRIAGPGLGPLEHEAAEDYLRDHTFALEFARENRRHLVARALAVIRDVVQEDIHAEPVLDVHHNFAARETWCGRTLVVHRKGAIAVPRGTLALVPGSMGTASYVVEGLGNPASFGSCSHGAGRVMSRTEARAAIRVEALASSMRRVVYPEHLARTLVEEAPAAYRDIREVLEDQADLVARRTRLEPIAVLKG